MNLIDANLKLQIKSAMEDIFDTFTRQDITFYLYKTPEETIVSLDNSYNGDWDVGNPDITYEEVKATFPVRLWFLDYEQQYKHFFLQGKEMEGVKAIRELGQIKVQLKEDGYNFIKDATRAVVFDTNWSISSDVKQVGILDFDYYTFILRKQP